MKNDMDIIPKHILDGVLCIIDEADIPAWLDTILPDLNKTMREYFRDGDFGVIEARLNRVMGPPQ